MTRTLLLAAAVAMTVIAVPTIADANGSTAPRKTLAAFKSEQELAELFKRWAEAAERRRQDGAKRFAEQGAVAAASPAPAPALEKSAAEPLADSITNVQHAGVDEGGIVKMHGDHLVILRRGRIFTVRVGGGALEPVSSSPGFGPDIDPKGAWYDELLMSGNTIAVICNAI